MGWTRTPPRIAPTGCSRNWNDVATPKFPPPPRTPQNRSGFSCSLACATRPSAVTRSTPRRLSQARPCFRARKPDPPPRVSPATPVAGTTPPVVANPARCAAASNSPQVTPPPTTAVRRSSSTRMSFISDRSITRPSSHTAFPDTLCPPPRTAKANPWSLAKPIDWITSSASLHRTITAGLRSIIAFQIRLASSYFASSGRMSSPCNRLANSTNSSSDVDTALPPTLDGNAGDRVKDLRSLSVSKKPSYPPSLENQPAKTSTAERQIPESTAPTPSALRSGSGPARARWSPTNASRFAKFATKTASMTSGTDVQRFGENKAAMRTAPVAIGNPIPREAAARWPAPRTRPPVPASVGYILLAYRVPGEERIVSGAPSGNVRRKGFKASPEFDAVTTLRGGYH